MTLWGFCTLHVACDTLKFSFGFGGYFVFIDEFFLPADSVYG